MYINEDRQKRLGDVPLAQTVGEMGWLIARCITRYYWNAMLNGEGDKSWQMILSAVLGELEIVKDEFKRECVAEYVKEKKRTNDDSVVVWSNSQLNFDEHPAKKSVFNMGAADLLDIPADIPLTMVVSPKVKEDIISTMVVE